MPLRTGNVRRFREPIAIVIFTLLLILPSHAQFTPAEDAYVNAASPATNYGSATTLNISSGSQTSYIQFDLSAVPSTYTGAQVAKATLKLFVNSVSTAGNFNIDLVAGSWTEKTITYDLQPAIGSTIASAVPLTSANKLNYIDVDITSTVQAWLNGTEPNDGIALVANSPLVASFTTKENTSTSHPPELDIVFLGSGAQGPAGPAGPQGPQGSQGATGPMGPTGAVGPAGASGPAGINNRGSWSSTAQYQINDSVSYIGSSWIALLPSLDSAPNSTNPNWQLLAAKGINNQGSWVQSVNYQVDDAVTDGGEFWLAVAPNTASEPSTLNPNWQLISATGAQGAAGPVGPSGPTGPTGPAGATGPQGPAGPTGAQGPQGASGAVGPQGPTGPQGPIGPQGLVGVMGPVGPIGPAGPQGDAGPAGPVGITNRGAWAATVSYNTNDAVADQGQYWLALSPSSGVEPPGSAGGPQVWLLIAEKGNDGAPGPTGPPGIGLPGPTGPTGPAGPQGSPGPIGPTGLPGTGILNGTQDFTGNGIWTAPSGVTRVIVELWGGGGGGGINGGPLGLTSGFGGGAGAYARSVIVVTPGNIYSVTIGAGGAEDVDGGASQFTDNTNTVLLQSGGGVQGYDGSGSKTCSSSPPYCGSGGTPSATAQIGHSGAGALPLGNCTPSGGPGYPVQGFSTTVGAGGSGAYSAAGCSVQPTISGQNGYAVLTW
jgi:hypothetical protein